LKRGGKNRAVKKKIKDLLRVFDASSTTKKTGGGEVTGGKHHNPLSKKKGKKGKRDETGQGPKLSWPGAYRGGGHQGKERTNKGKCGDDDQKCSSLQNSSHKARGKGVQKAKESLNFPPRRKEGKKKNSRRWCHFRKKRATKKKCEEKN